ncbi:ubiquinone biosynthesis protein COQ9, mitochondrial-like [Tubulanus polymorphus]|uniref:ubiquinone biosynthesis protein COQ9, mitochondrial-like n=1 Tax=Tubulanus polymorphus TaxID=672921 RepID=UPI003DA2F734
MLRCICRSSLELPSFGLARILVLRNCSSTAGGTSSSDSESDSSSDEGYTEEELKGKILEAAVNHVHEHGWTSNAIGAGAVDLGLPAVTQGLFPRGGIELVHYFYTDCNKRLADVLSVETQQIKAGKTDKRPVPVFIKDALETRLQMIIPYINTWPQAMGLQALPQNSPTALRNLTRLVDDIWYYAGDNSHDMNWYTKRAMLAYVYKTSEIYMTQDTSEGHKDTWMFLDRRLNEVQKAGKCIQQMRGGCSSLSDVLSSAGTVLQNMLRMNSWQR